MNMLNNIVGFIMGLFSKMSNYSGWLVMALIILMFSKVFSFKVKK